MKTKKTSLYVSVIFQKKSVSARIDHKPRNNQVNMFKTFFVDAKFYFIGFSLEKKLKMDCTCFSNFSTKLISTKIDNKPRYNQQNIFKEFFKDPKRKTK